MHENVRYEKIYYAEIEENEITHGIPCWWTPDRGLHTFRQGVLPILLKLPYIR